MSSTFPIPIVTFDDLKDALIIKTFTSFKKTHYVTDDLITQRQKTVMICISATDSPKPIYAEHMDHGICIKTADPCIKHKRNLADFKTLYIVIFFNSSWHWFEKLPSSKEVTCQHQMKDLLRRCALHPAHITALEGPPPSWSKLPNCNSALDTLKENICDLAGGDDTVMHAELCLRLRQCCLQKLVDRRRAQRQRREADKAARLQKRRDAEKVETLSASIELLVEAVKLSNDPLDEQGVEALCRISSQLYVLADELEQLYMN